MHNYLPKAGRELIEDGNTYRGAGISVPGLSYSPEKPLRISSSEKLKLPES